MPKRPKAKVKTISTDKGPSVAKQNRINKQAEQEGFNKETKAVHLLTPWQLSKGNRRATRILLGKHEAWLTKKAKLQETTPNASNLLVK